MKLKSSQRWHLDRCLSAALRLHRRFEGGGGAVSVSKGIFCWMVGEECDLLEKAAQKCEVTDV